MKIFEKYGMSKTIQFFVGVFLLLLIIILGATLFPDPAPGKESLMFRMFIGLAIGYALSRAFMGFAGTVNRAYKTGSTKLMKTIALLFLMGGVATFILVLGGKMNGASLPGNTINAGLLIGATLFGFGMSFGVCCASGVLTDLADSPLRALVVLFFFCAGGFLGLVFKNQSWMSWYNKDFAGLEKGNLNFTTWFKWDGANGAIGALLLTLVLVIIVIVLCNIYEAKRKANNTYTGVECEKCYEAECAIAKENQSLAYRLIAKPWSMTIGALVIAICFFSLLAVTGSGWGVSGPLGQWFARFIKLFGVESGELAKFIAGANASNPDAVGKIIKWLDGPFFQNPMYVQDLSIFAGAIIYLLMSGRFWKPKEWLFKPLEIVFFAFGGLCLGIAINLAGGCNAGGLFTPIASFSLSGWVYLVCIVAGGFLGNFCRKRLYKVCKLDY